MSTPLDNLYHDIPRRDPAVVMRLERMGASHQGRLSFMRILLRRMKAENWRFDIPLFEIDARGVGQAVLFGAWSRTQLFFGVVCQ